MAGEIVDKVALAFGGNPPVSTDPPGQTKQPEALPPPPAPPPDTTERVGGQGNANPPVGIPNGGNEPDPMEQGRRMLRYVEDTGDADALARFLRELRQNSGITVARGVAQMIFHEASHHYDPEHRISAERYVQIKMSLVETMQYGVPLQHA